MKIIYNKFFPCGKFVAINIFGIIFARDKYKDLSKSEVNHEKIHTSQIIELLGVFYYLIYFIEWLIRRIQYNSFIEAYQNISFEREAYQNEKDINYRNKRKPFSFVNYYKKRNYPFQ